MPDYQDLLSQCYGNSPEEAIRIAVEVYKDASKYLKDIQAKAKQIIEEVSIETGRTDWSTQAGKVYYPAPGVAVSYDSKALDALCASDPDLKAKLWPHRRETERAGSMTIK
jgi:hypothetical protein